MELTLEGGAEETDEALVSEDIMLLLDGGGEEDEEAGVEEPGMELAGLYSGRIFVRYAMGTQPVPELNVILHHP